LEYPFTSNIEDFPLIYERKINYLDSATKTLFPKSLWNKIIEFYNESGVAPRRGAHKPTITAGKVLEETRREVASLINTTENNIIFTSNRHISTTMIMMGYPWNKKDKIIISDAEHHSILVPVLTAAKKFDLTIIDIGRDQNDMFNVEKFEEKIDKSCKIVIITLVPMILGNMNPLREITKIAHDYNSIVITDCSRGMIHSKIDFDYLNCDAMIFSGCVGITGLEGVSVLCSRPELLKKLKPIISGGGAVSNATKNGYTASNYPDKFEPGLINMSAIVGLKEGINYLRKIGLDKIREYNMRLLNKLLIELRKLERVKIYGSNIKKGAPILSFNIEGLNPHDVALFLDDINKIAVRSGMQCSHPLARSLSEKGVIQVSLHLYNTPEAIDNFIETLNLIISELS